MTDWFFPYFALVKYLPLKQSIIFTTSHALSGEIQEITAGNGVSENQGNTIHKFKNRKSGRYRLLVGLRVNYNEK